MTRINKIYHKTKSGKIKKNPKSKYNQIVVWRGTVVGKSKKKKFEDWFEKQGFRIKYIEEIKTFPDRDSSGKNIEGTGNRNDVLFYIHDNDISKFTIWRLQYRMLWLEDAIDNDPEIYPERVHKMRKW